MNRDLSAVEFASLCSDLSRKAAEDCSRAINTTLDLAMMAGGPGAVTSIMLHVAGKNMSSVTTCLAIARDRERGMDPRSISDLAYEDFLFCCLFIAAGFMLGENPEGIPTVASEMFRRLTGHDPDVPNGWKGVAGEIITNGRAQ